MSHPYMTKYKAANACSHINWASVAEREKRGFNATSYSMCEINTFSKLCMINASITMI